MAIGTPASNRIACDHRQSAAQRAYGARWFRFLDEGVQTQSTQIKVTRPGARWMSF